MTTATAAQAFNEDSGEPVAWGLARAGREETGVAIRDRLIVHAPILDANTAGPYNAFMLIAVAQTAAFTAQARSEGMSDAEIENAIAIVAANPTGGVSLGAGLYKVRVPREGGGKSGGYRVITLYVADDTPVVLLAVLSKGRAANFTARAMSKIREKAREIKRPK